MSRHEPTLSGLSVLQRDPVVSQAVSWNWGPLSDSTEIRVTRTGNTVSLDGWRTSTFPTLDLDQARLLRDALTNVIEWKEGQP